MSYFKYQGKNIYYEETGNGRPLLLLHGNTASSNMFYEITGKYAAHHKVILMDFLGHGRSDRLPEFPADLWFDEAMQVIELIKSRQYGNHWQQRGRTGRNQRGPGSAGAGRESHC